ncbi:MAG: hypothetical protein AAGN82_19840 [Myxococcota bacterium]
MLTRLCVRPRRSLATAVGWFATAVATGGCADADRIEPPVPVVVDHTVEFVGFAFDATTGERLTGYTLELLTGATAVEGTVAADGRFQVGPISVWSDYTVRIDAGDYRAFVSHNPRTGLPDAFAQSDDIADIATQQVFFYDAYLFPASLQSPAVTFTVTTPIGTPPDGSIRLRPSLPSVLTDETFETPSGIPGQLWFNDEDVQAATLSQSFSNGTVDVSAGALVYGVTYAVSIFDVEAHQPFSGAYRAGIETDKTFALAEELAEPLVVVSSDEASCTPPPLPGATSSAEVMIQFNATIELEDADVANEALDSNLSIVSADDDLDMMLNVLAPDASNMAIERGVSIVATGDTLMISFNPASGLDESDPDDAITNVTYGGLADIVVRRPGSPSSAVTLAAALGLASISCNP